jgi:hypothetical protein
MMELGFGFVQPVPEGSSHKDAFPVFVTPDSHKWEKDKTVLSCHACKRVFSTFFRRHHCRVCGNIFCKRCSNCVVVHQRVCQRCYGKWNHLEGSASRRVSSGASASAKKKKHRRYTSDSLHTCDTVQSGKLLSLSRSYQINLAHSDDAVPLLKFYKLSRLTIKAVSLVSYVTTLDMSGGFFRVNTSAAFRTVKEEYRLDHAWRKVDTPQGEKMARAGVITPVLADLSTHVYIFVVYDDTHVIASTRKIVRLSPSSSSSSSSFSPAPETLHLEVNLAVYQCDAKHVRRLLSQRQALPRSMSEGNTPTLAEEGLSTPSPAAVSKINCMARFKPLRKPVEELEKALWVEGQQPVLKLKRVFDLLDP